MKKEKKVKNLFINGIFLFLRGVFFLILGFLPSFIFIALFIQYGSPFSNYVNFLFNFKESWVAWVSAIVIIFLLFSVGKGIRDIKEFKHSKKKKMTWVLIAISMLFVVGLIVGQLYLYVNFVLGNDILVQVSSDKDNFLFSNLDEEEVNFKISVTMNPFCVAVCEYDFFDLSKGESIESGTFNIASIFSKTRTYTLKKSEVDPGSQVLKQFRVTCKTKKTLFCFTKEKENKRTTLITLNNVFSEEERRVLENYKDNIISLRQIFYLAGNSFDELKLNLDNLNNSFFVNYPITILEKRFSELDNSFNGLQRLWRFQELDSLRVQIPSWENDIFDFYNLVGSYNKNLSIDFSIYNNLTEKIRVSKQILGGIKSRELPEEICSNLNQTIFNFNKAVFNFENELTLIAKKEIIENIYSEVLVLSEVVNGNIGGTLCDVDNISEKNFNKIVYSTLDKSISDIVLGEPLFSCCYLGNCEKCCDDFSCANKYYPVIFLHGHSINGALPADYSFDSFMEMKWELSKEGYIDAGEFVLSEDEGTGFWGRINTPVMVTASYFFDAYKTSSGETITISSKTDGIDTYAIRLRNIVKIVKERTGKDKVIIVAHSMGGVVTRRYIQIFGGNDLDKVILISVPNHGISDKVKDFCAVFGAETACNDMREDSILINQLNNAVTDSVEIHNIIGLGCNMGDEMGDGIIKMSSQYLDGSKNYYVNGTCNEVNFDFFHETILYPDVYPKVYNIVKKLLI